MAKKKGKGCLIIVGVIIVLAVITSMFGDKKQDEQAKKT